MNKTHLQIFHTIWVYLGWFGCVYLGKIGWGGATFIFPLVAWTTLHLTFSLNRSAILRLLILCLAGILFDCAGVYFKLIQIVPPTDIGWLPIWMISLWLLFTTSLPLLQNLLKKRYLLASLLGAIFGPLSYRAGAQFETLITNGMTALVIYSFFWAIFIPIALFWLHQGQREKTK